jgi:hypothetical protein
MKLRHRHTRGPKPTKPLDIWITYLPATSTSLEHLDAPGYTFHLVDIVTGSGTKEVTEHWRGEP